MQSGGALRKCLISKETQRHTIELVIANHPGVVFEVIEKIDHQFALVSEAHLCTLIDVADIDQDRVRILPPPSADLRDATRQTAAISSSVVI